MKPLKWDSGEVADNRAGPLTVALFFLTGGLSGVALIFLPEPSNNFPEVFRLCLTWALLLFPLFSKLPKFFLQLCLGLFIGTSILWPLRGVSEYGQDLPMVLLALGGIVLLIWAYVQAFRPNVRKVLPWALVGFLACIYVVELLGTDHWLVLGFVSSLTWGTAGLADWWAVRFRGSSKTVREIYKTEVWPGAKGWWRQGWAKRSGLKEAVLGSRLWRWPLGRRLVYLAGCLTMLFAGFVMAAEGISDEELALFLLFLAPIAVLCFGSGEVLASLRRSSGLAAFCQLGAILNVFLGFDPGEYRGLMVYSFSLWFVVFLADLRTIDPRLLALAAAPQETQGAIRLGALLKPLTDLGKKTLPAISDLLMGRYDPVVEPARTHSSNLRALLELPLPGVGLRVAGCAAVALALATGLAALDPALLGLQKSAPGTDLGEIRPAMIQVPEPLFYSQKDTRAREPWTFSISQTEVLRGQFDTLTAAVVSDLGGERDPVQDVGPTDILSYCDALSRAENLEPCYEAALLKIGLAALEGKAAWSEAQLSFPQNLQRCSGYRLPTDGEWSYAITAAGRMPETPADSAGGQIMDVLDENPWGLLGLSNGVEELVHTDAGQAICGTRRACVEVGPAGTLDRFGFRIVRSEFR